MEQERKDLLTIYQSAIDAVAGDVVVKKSLLTSGYTVDCHVIAIGKVADSMMQGALDVLGDKLLTGLVITKEENFSTRILDESRMQCVVSDHPVPTNKSLQAGRHLLAYIERLPANARCLVLISGGASSLVEVLVEGETLAGLQLANQTLLGSGKGIHDINAARKRMSRIKGGGLWRFLGSREVRCLMISDVQGDDPAIIGSGLLFPEPMHYPLSFSWEIIATLDQAKAAAKRQAKYLGYTATIIPSFMQGNTEDAGQYCVEMLDQANTEVIIWGGETTVTLPDNPVAGGRNQHLALSAAMALSGKKNKWLLSIATDGVDGSTQEAGALVDGRSVQRGELYGVSAAYCLQQANANLFLEESGDLIYTGASNTNVMDLVIGLKQ